MWVVFWDHSASQDYLPALQLQHGILSQHPFLFATLSFAYRHCLWSPCNTCKVIRSMRSKDAYLKRKRDSQRHRIVEAEKMVGKKIEVRNTVGWAPPRKY